MKIEIDINDLGFEYDYEGDVIGRGSIKDLIVAEAARQIVGESEELRTAVKKRVQEELDEAIDGRIVEYVTDAMTAPIQRMTSWGEKVGETTTVREIIRQKIEDYLKGSSSRDPYRSSNSTPANLSELVDREIKNIMNGELQGTVKEAKNLVHKRVTTEALQAAVAVLSKEK